MKNQDAHTQVLQPTFQMSEKTHSPAHATLTIEPLEQGYAHTIGNALRRVLLTSLPGSALTKVQIKGADHQFATIEGVTEDVLELTLNLKQVRLRSTLEGAGVLRLSVKGPKKVTAADLEAESGIEVVNPEQHIATVAKGHALELELTAESGLGYEVADEKNVSAIGEIALDALFSPVVKVSYKVESTRVGRRTDYDQLILDVLTDETISPADAVRRAAEILTKQFTQIVNPVTVSDQVVDAAVSPEEAEVLRLTVEELDLPTRIANALRKGGFKTVGDLSGAPRMTIAKVKNLGEKSVGVVDAALQKKGVSLGE